MNIKEKIEFLEKYANKDECDGNCDQNSPYKECIECLARQTLNMVAEILDSEIIDIKEMENNDGKH